MNINKTVIFILLCTKLSNSYLSIDYSKCFIYYIFIFLCTQYHLALLANAYRCFVTIIHFVLFDMFWYACDIFGYKK